MQIEGLIDKINRMESSIEELRTAIAVLGSNTVDNFQILEKRLAEMLAEAKKEVLDELRS
jgi:hypothetical protein